MTLKYWNRKMGAAVLVVGKAFVSFFGSWFLVMFLQQERGANKKTSEQTTRAEYVLVADGQTQVSMRRREGERRRVVPL